jgi:hypothetical protein
MREGRGRGREEGGGKKDSVQDDVPSVLVGDLNVLRKILSHLLHNPIKV